MRLEIQARDLRVYDRLPWQEAPGRGSWWDERLAVVERRLLRVDFPVALDVLAVEIVLARLEGLEETVVAGSAGPRVQRTVHWNRSRVWRLRPDQPLTVDRYSFAELLWVEDCRRAERRAQLDRQHSLTRRMMDFEARFGPSSCLDRPANW